MKNGIHKKIKKVVDKKSIDGYTIEVSPIGNKATGS